MIYCRCHRGTVTQMAFHVSNNQMNSLEVVIGTHTHTHIHTHTKGGITDHVNVTIL